MLPLLSFLFLGMPLVAASSSPEPCALITKQIREHQKYNNSVSVLQFPGQLAEDCLQSIPFYPELADPFLDELGKQKHLPLSSHFLGIQMLRKWPCLHVNP